MIFFAVTTGLLYALWGHTDLATSTFSTPTLFSRRPPFRSPKGLIICITSPGRGIIRNGFGTTISMDRQIPTGRAGGMARGRSRDLQHPMFGRQTLTAGRTAWGWPRQLIVGAAQYIPRQLANPQGYDGPGEARRANTRERFFSRPPLP